jgi:hypothetical protein
MAEPCWVHKIGLEQVLASFMENGVIETTAFRIARLSELAAIPTLQAVRSPTMDAQEPRS